MNCLQTHTSNMPWAVSSGVNALARFIACIFVYGGGFFSPVLSPHFFLRLIIKVPKWLGQSIWAKCRESI